MLRMLASIFSIITYTCLATFVIQAGLIGYMYSKKMITTERNEKAYRVLYGLDWPELVEAEVIETLAPKPLTYRQIRHNRHKIGLNQDLRGSSLVAGVDNLDYLKDRLKSRQRRFERLRREFESSYARLRGVQTDEGLVHVRKMIQAMEPSVAAYQMEQMARSGDRKRQHDVLAILKTLPSGHQKKILAEFKKDEDKKRILNDLLDQLRLGMPEMAVVHNARKELNQYRDTLLKRKEP